MNIAHFLLIGLVLQPFLPETFDAPPIHDATAAGSVEVVRSLIAEDPEIVKSLDDNNRTPLHLAVQNGHADLVGILLDAGADIEAVDRRGNTPLLAAIQGNNLSMVKALADRGARLDVEHPSYGLAIEVAYWFECMKGRSGITEFLISHGQPFDPNSESAIATRLNLATTFGNLDMAKFALSLGADVNKVSTPDGKTELHFAVSCGHPEIAKLFIEHGAKVNVTNAEGVPPIWDAVDGRHAGTVKLLLEHGSPCDYVDPSTSRNLLHLAALRGQADVVELLLARGFDIDAADGLGHMPMYYAEMYGHSRVETLLLDSGAADPSEIAIWGVPAGLEQAVDRGEAVGWALMGAGWAVKTSEHLLLIDALQATLSPPTNPSLRNGFVNASEITDQDIFVIYSTYHWPDVVEYVHSIEDSLKNVTYIHNKKEPWRGCKNTVYIEPYQPVDLGALKLRSIQATHFQPALSFVCEIDGLKIYCGIFAADDADTFANDLDSLKASVGSVDLALIPIPARPSEENTFLKPLIEKLSPKTIWFADRKGRTDLYREMERKIRSWGSTASVFGPENPGDQFFFGGQ